MRGGWVVALAVGVCSCGPQSGSAARLNLTPSSQHRSVIVAAGAAALGALVAWDLLDGSPPEPLLLPFSQQGDLQITALYYSQPLQGLGLSAGALRRTQDGLPLPTPDRVERARASPESISDWVVVPSLPADISDVRIVRRSPCADFEVSFYDLPFAAEVSAIVSVSETEAWVLAADGQLWRASSDGSFTLLAAGLPEASAVAGAPGELWVGGSGGRVFSLQVQGDVATVTSTLALPTAGRVDALAMPVTGTRPVFALTSLFELFGGGPQGWSLLAQVDDDVEDVGGLAAFNEQQALFGFESGLLAYEWNGEELLRESVPVNALDSGLTALAYWPDFGSVIGSATGEIVLRPAGSDTWTRLNGAYAVLDIYSLARYETGLVYSDERGVVVQYVPGFGFCPVVPPPLAAIAEGRLMSGWGLDLVAAGSAPDEGPERQIFWYHRELR